MRYTLTAVVAASLAATTLAAHGHMNAHHQHHAREAEAEPAAEAEPEPTNYTYSDGQCWGTYGCNSKTAEGGVAQTQAAAATTAAPVIAAAVTSAVAAPASQVQKAVSQATAAVNSVASSASSSTDGSVNVANLLSATTGDSKILSAVTGSSCAVGGGSSARPNVMEIQNQSGDDLVWVCWGSAGSWVNSVAPIIALGVPSGGSNTLEFADTAKGQQGGACAPVFKGTKLTDGQIMETWLESTFNEYGDVDVSREVSITGHSISATTAASCTTDMETCVFKCNSQSGDPSTPGQCGKAGSYSILNCTGKGANTPDKTNPVDGGCQVGNGKMTVTVGKFVSSW